ncbi:PAS domain-containing sensor histidine kinase [Rubricoccus marinus]|uniref:Histidine kinase n=1 Tax=Rubricoccus marinus TaxID=716817 RepID=A0A259TY09_9BACT|nr:PAS domain S-box protein [Rubricoccus marinus]OZC02507.1 hypothetical protein BSZ36_05660 [Rubricoccus marinus]
MPDDPASGAPHPQEEHLRLLFENAHEYAIFTLGTDARISLWNTGAERVLGWIEAEAIGMSGEVIFTPEQRASGVPEAEMARSREHGRAEDVRWHVRKDGSRFWANGMMISLRDESGELRGYAKILRDETERKVAEDALSALRQTLEVRVAERTAQVQHLAAQLADAETESYRRAASILHDDVQQRLYGVHLGIGALVRELVDAGYTAFAEKARRLRGWTGEALERTRGLAIDLTPPASGESTFGGALRALCEQANDLYNFRVDVDESDEAIRSAEENLTPEAVGLLVQCVREAVFNAVKHSGTQSASVCVRDTGTHTDVEIHDAGQGFDASSTPGGLGHAGMRARMGLVGGSVTISSIPGDGAMITLRVPHQAGPAAPAPVPGSTPPRDA